MISLRRRAIIGGAVSAVFSVIVGFFIVATFVDAVAERRFDSGLRDRHVQLLVALSYSGPDQDLLRGVLIDPAYSLPNSGRYWQAVSADGTILTSRSLFDNTLQLPEPSTSLEMTNDVASALGEQLRAAHERITLEDGSTWTITVAESISRLHAEQSQIRLSLLQAFALLGLIGLAAAIFQISAVLGPLQHLQRDVANRWDSGEAMDPEEYPEEVAPLVSDINTLLERNRDIVARARRQAADLAHALKTPSAILRNELGQLSAAGTDVEQAQEALDRVDAQLGRSLARIRATNSASSSQAMTDLSNSVDRFARLFRSMAEKQHKVFHLKTEPGLKIRMDKQDIEEVLGNLLDNALKWCAGQVKLTARMHKGSVQIIFEDDGPGIPEGSRREALRSGGRLDSSTPGTGLGLAIAVDLLAAYGGTLELADSEDLGGLAVIITMADKPAKKRGRATAVS